MRTIYKYPNIRPDGNSYIVELPRSAEIVKVEKDYFWAEVYTESDIVECRFQVVPTGGAVPRDADYRGTWFDGPFVWHLYEVYG